MTWADIEFFNSAEFDSSDIKGSGKHMNLKFVHKLDLLRGACGFPLIVDSGFRTPAHNALVGGEQQSAHLLGLAADLRATSSSVRFAILKNAYALGFRRIGIGQTFIHLDMSEVLAQDVVWTYGPEKKVRML